jgi:transcriptional regulator with XRE-family HTH domain
MKNPPEDWPRLGRYIASARLAAGFETTRSFADALGITERTIGDLERGNRVGRNTLLAAAKAVGWTPDSPWKILAGAEPVMLAREEEPSVRRAAARAAEEEALRSILEDERLPLTWRQAMVELARIMDRAEADGGA